MTVGQRIKQVRLELGLTQLELAQKMGYSGKTSVCAAETCGDNITTTKVRKFADALGVSFHYLMGYEDRFGNPIPTSSEATDNIDTLLIRETYKHFTPDELNDPVLAKQIGAFMDFLKQLDPKGRDALLDFAKSLKF